MAANTTIGQARVFGLGGWLIQCLKFLCCFQCPLLRTLHSEGTLMDLRRQKAWGWGYNLGTVPHSEGHLAR